MVCLGVLRYFLVLTLGYSNTVFAGSKWIKTTKHVCDLFKMFDSIRCVNDFSYGI